MPVPLLATAVGDVFGLVVELVEEVLVVDVDVVVVDEPDEDGLSELVFVIKLHCDWVTSQV